MTTRHDLDDTVAIIHRYLVWHRFLPAAMTVERWLVLRDAIGTGLTSGEPPAWSAPAVDDLFTDPSTPRWMRAALEAAMDVDAVDAAACAAVMAKALADRADRMLSAACGE